MSGTVCPGCHLAVAEYAKQVRTPLARCYHYDCYEALYQRRRGRRPRLNTADCGPRHIYLGDAP